MMSDDRDQELVAGVLRETPKASVPSDFLARVNARIDETSGWLGVADFRAWTLGLVPAAAALVLVALLWPASTSSRSVTSAATQTTAQTFSPSSYTDWQQDVTANALLDAALRPIADNR